MNRVVFVAVAVFLVAFVSFSVIDLNESEAYESLSSEYPDARWVDVDWFTVDDPYSDFRGWSIAFSGDFVLTEGTWFLPLAAVQVPFTGADAHSFIDAWAESAVLDPFDRYGFDYGVHYTGFTCYYGIIIESEPLGCLATVYSWDSDHSGPHSYGSLVSTDNVYFVDVPDSLDITAPDVTYAEDGTPYIGGVAV